MAAPTVRVIVADDEPVARRRVVRLLEAAGGASVVAACAGGRDTVRQVLALKPDLLFLDVQMPDLGGFEVVAAIPEAVRPAIVFVTAYDRYAIKAFDVHAEDYLLKPFDTARFTAAFERARRRIADPWLDRVSVSGEGAIKVIRVEDVDWFEADGNYVKVQAGAAQYRVRMTLSALESRLDPHRFMRTHRSFIVNVERVVEIQPWFAGHSILVLKSGKVSLSRSHRRRLQQRLGARMKGAAR